jgi:hypothetical protein
MRQRRTSRPAAFIALVAGLSLPAVAGAAEYEPRSINPDDARTADVSFRTGPVIGGGGVGALGGVDGAWHVTPRVSVGLAIQSVAGADNSESGCGGSGDCLYEFTLVNPFVQLHTAGNRMTTFDLWLRVGGGYAYLGSNKEHATPSSSSVGNLMEDVGFDVRVAAGPKIAFGPHLSFFQFSASQANAVSFGLHLGLQI